MQKRFFLIGIALFLLSCSLSTKVKAEKPLVTAKSAVVMDALTGEVLFSKDMQEKRYPASTTKILTAIVALEKGKLEDTFIVSEKAASTEGSSLYLEKGERFKLIDLIYGLLMVSGNDAAVCIAENLAGGSVDLFVEWMNETAKKIGANSSHFVNPNGLPDIRHYTTAYDLALIASYAYRVPLFAKIVATKEKNMSWRKHEFQKELFNTNKLLWRYEGANGVKTGYTNDAGHCLVSGAKKFGVQLVAVVLDSDDQWGDSTKILDYGFSKVNPLCYYTSGEKVDDVWVKGGEKSKVSAVIADSFYINLFNNKESFYSSVVNLPHVIAAPIKKGQELGSVSIMYKNKEIAKLPLVARRSVEKKSFFAFLIKWFKGI